MTPDTKGQPEPVAWMVEYRNPFPTADRSLHFHEITWESPGELVTPLYDYDVPALLARQENLVEALEQCCREVDPDRMRVSDHVPSEERIWHICRTALAAAREEP